MTDLALPAASRLVAGDGSPASETASTSPASQPGEGEPQRAGLARRIDLAEAGTGELLPMVLPRCLGGGPSKPGRYYASDEPPRHLA